MEKPEIQRKEAKSNASKHSKRKFDENKLWAVAGNIQSSKFTYIDYSISVFHIKGTPYSLVKVLMCFTTYLT
jgi:hypothetical protein